MTQVLPETIVAERKPPLERIRKFLRGLCFIHGESDSCLGNVAIGVARCFSMASRWLCAQTELSGIRMDDFFGGHSVRNVRCVFCS